MLKYQRILTSNIAGPPVCTSCATLYLDECRAALPPRRTINSLHHLVTLAGDDERKLESLALLEVSCHPDLSPPLLIYKAVQSQDGADGRSRGPLEVEFEFQRDVGPIELPISKFHMKSGEHQSLLDFLPCFPFALP